MKRLLMVSSALVLWSSAARSAPMAAATAANVPPPAVNPMAPSTAPGATTTPDVPAEQPGTSPSTAASRAPRKIQLKEEDQEPPRETAAPHPDGSTPPQETKDDAGGPAVPVDSFQDALAGDDGQWVTVDGVGSVWQPPPAVVGTNFLPYGTGGHWVYTRAGWVWVSDYSWGWATFHYGNWWQDPRYGWVWRPGATWAPAWVNWRYGTTYVGWGPTPPRGLVYATNAQTRTVVTTLGEMTATNVLAHALAAGRFAEAFQQTHAVPIPAEGYVRGPPVEVVAHAAGTDIRPVPLAHLSGVVSRPDSARPARVIEIPVAKETRTAPSRKAGRNHQTSVTAKQEGTLTIAPKVSGNGRGRGSRGTTGPASHTTITSAKTPYQLAVARANAAAAARPAFNPNWKAEAEANYGVSSGGGGGGGRRGGGGRVGEGGRRR